MLKEQQTKQLDVIIRSIKIDGDLPHEILAALIISESLKSLEKEIQYCMGKIAGTMDKNTKQICEEINLI